MDRFEGNLIYHDKSIDIIEKCLYDHNIITEYLSGNSQMENDKIQNYDKSRKKKNLYLWKIQQILFLLAMVRYGLLAIDMDKNRISPYLGETFRSLGLVFRMVMYTSILGEGSFSIAFHFITRYFESRQELHFMYDLKHLKGLSPKNYRKFVKISKIVAFLVPKLMIMNYMIFIPLCSLGIYKGYFITSHSDDGISNENISGSKYIGYTFTEMLTFIPAMILLIQTCRYISAIFYILIPFVTLPTLYLTMRFDQIHSLLDEILKSKSLKENVELLKYFIRIHGELTQKVFQYNNVIKWYLIITHYTLGGVLALLIYALISGTHTTIVAPLFIVSNICGILSGMTIICGISSMIHTTTNNSYHKLNVIFVAYGKYYDYETKMQLVNVIEMISSLSKPVSFYCHDIFPFRKTSVFEVFASLFALVLLLVKSTQ